MSRLPNSAPDAAEPVATRELIRRAVATAIRTREGEAQVDAVTDAVYAEVGPLLDRALRVASDALDEIVAQREARELAMEVMRSWKAEAEELRAELSARPRGGWWRPGHAR